MEESPHGRALPGEAERDVYTALNALDIQYAPVGATPRADVLVRTVHDLVSVVVRERPEVHDGVRGNPRAGQELMLWSRSSSTAAQT